MIESELEVICRTCKHVRKDLHEEPCESCFCYDRWEKFEEKTADETLKEWERRIFDDLK